MPPKIPSLSLLEQIKAGQYMAPPAQYSKDLRALVTAMLQTSPTKRPSVSAILSASPLRDRIDKFLTETLRYFSFYPMLLAGTEAGYLCVGAHLIQDVRRCKIILLY